MPDPSNWTTAITTAVTVLGTLGGTVGGYFLSARNEEKRDERAAKREAIARRDELAERRDDQRHESQRQTLYELQNELQELAAITAKMLIGELSAIQYSKSTDRDELSGVYAARSRAIHRLRTRILDDELRDDVNTFVGVASGYWLDLTVSREQWSAIIEERIQQLNIDYTIITEHLGQHLRHELKRDVRGGALDLPSPR